MGRVERIGGHLVGSRPVLLADTGMVFNGCRVMLGISSVEQGKDLVPKFKGMIGNAMNRASKVNMDDMIEAQVKFREGILN